MVCTSAYSLLVASLICVPGKQHTSLENASIWQMGGSVPLRGESPTTITGCLLLVLHFVIKGAYQADLVCSSISPDGTALFSSVCRAVKQICKGTSGFRGCSLPPVHPFHCRFPFFHTVGIPPFCVCWWGISWLFCCVSTTHCTWKQLSSFFSDSLMLHSLLTASYRSTTCCRTSSTWAHLL